MSNLTMELSKAVQAATAHLNGVSATPRLDAELLLSHVLQVSRSYLHAHGEATLTASKRACFEVLVSRRKAHEPLAYLLEQKEFWSLPLRVTSAVLIPRPETELLVELALKHLPLNEAARIADLGTGSGAIALALASSCPNWQIDATDLSDAALAIAQENAKRLVIPNIRFWQGPWCAALPRRQYTAIISNPPYIDVASPHYEGDALRYEPKSALFAANQGMAALEEIILEARDYLAPQGILILEHGFDQGLPIVKLLRAAGYHTAEIFQDFAGKDRATIASWQN